MEKTSNLLLKVTRRLFTNVDEQTKFIDALVHPQPFPPCILWCQDKPDISPFELEMPTSWQPQFVDRL
ncbi:MAG: RsmB/NOP family class I SAM-dependent RNA methyltransferase, partial [Cuspidothrix sp.]